MCKETLTEYLEYMYDRNEMDFVTFDLIDGLVCVYEKCYYIGAFTLEYFQVCYFNSFGTEYKFI